jgi:hypothetical protein
MRLKEITEPAPEKGPVNGMLIRSILGYIQAGNWPKAIMMGAISAAPQLKPYLTGDQWRVLNYAVNTVGAVTFWNGLSAFMTRIGVPTLAMVGWHGKLNTGEQDELNKRHYPPVQASVRKIDNQTPTSAERDFAP